MSPEEQEVFRANEKAARLAEKAAIEARVQESYEVGRPRFVFDCSYSDILAPKEITSLAKQLQMSYLTMRNFGPAVQFHICSVDKFPTSLPENYEPVTLGERMFSMHLQKYKWHAHQDGFWDVFSDDLDKIVMLSPDAQNELTAVEEDKIYVFGGIVDRSVKKQQTLTQAKARGVKCARLPSSISDDMFHQHAPLNINTVADILMHVLRNGNEPSSWVNAFLEHVPLRRRIEYCKEKGKM